MTCGILEEKQQLESLRAEYDAAFEEWALQVRRLLAIAGSAPSSVVKETEASVAAAELAYRLSRDRLMEGVLNARQETNGCRKNKSLLETLEEQDRWLLENKTSINAKIRRGIDELDRGEGIPESQLDANLAKLKTQPE